MDHCDIGFLIFLYFFSVSLHISKPHSFQDKQKLKFTFNDRRPPQDLDGTQGVYSCTADKTNHGGTFK